MLTQVSALLQAYQLKTLGAHLPLLCKNPLLAHARKKVSARNGNASTRSPDSEDLLDGPEQCGCDDATRGAMASELDSKTLDWNPNQWADRAKSRFQFDDEAYGEIERWWAGGGKERIEALAGGSGRDCCHESSTEEMVGD